ncbi:MAG: hypothetical protein JW736_03960 [Deltaproteobacteria bacterium]|nr:hypothetical protein [Deltaproteobacteria bacterium]
MNQNVENRRQLYTPGIVMPLLRSSLIAGLICGGLLVFLTSYAPGLCWGDIILYSRLIEDISTFQGLMLVILILLLTGMFPAALRRCGDCRAQNVLSGGISGFMAFFVSCFLVTVTSLFGHRTPVGFQDLLDAICLLAGNCLIILAYALFMAVIAAIGAVSLTFISVKTTGCKEGDRSSRLILGSMAVLIVAVTILPPLCAHAMLDSGAMDVEDPWYFFLETAVSVERTAPDTLVITFDVIPTTSVLDTRMPFSVFMNGADVSNASACAASDFAATVEPAGGLTAVEGSQAAWQGAGVMNNGSAVDVAIMVHGKDGTNLVILNGMY